MRHSLVQNTLLPLLQLFPIRCCVYLPATVEVGAATFWSFLRKSFNITYTTYRHGLAPCCAKISTCSRYKLLRL